MLAENQLSSIVYNEEEVRWSTVLFCFFISSRCTIAEDHDGAKSIVGWASMRGSGQWWVFRCWVYLFLQSLYCIFYHLYYFWVTLNSKKTFLSSSQLWIPIKKVTQRLTNAFFFQFSSRTTESQDEPHYRRRSRPSRSVQVPDLVAGERTELLRWRHHRWQIHSHGCSLRRWHEGQILPGQVPGRSWCYRSECRTRRARQRREDLRAQGVLTPAQR